MRDNTSFIVLLMKASRDSIVFPVRFPIALAVILGAFWVVIGAPFWTESTSNWKWIVIPVGTLLACGWISYSSKTATSILLIRAIGRRTE